MTWAVACRNEIVTDHALVALGHHEFAEALREQGEVRVSTARAVFADEIPAVACANRMASTFPEDEVALWRLEQRAEATPWPGRQRAGACFSVAVPPGGGVPAVPGEGGCGSSRGAASSNGAGGASATAPARPSAPPRVEVDSRVDPIRALVEAIAGDPPPIIVGAPLAVEDWAAAFEHANVLGIAVGPDGALRFTDTAAAMRTLAAAVMTDYLQATTERSGDA